MNVPKRLVRWTILPVLPLLLSTLALSAQSDAGLVARGNRFLADYETAYLADRTQAARALLNAGIELLRGQGQDTLLGKFYNLYTYWYYQEGEAEAALDAQQKAARLFERGFGPAEPTAFALHNVAFLQARVAGRPDSAVHYYHRARRIYADLDYPVDVADEWRNVGLVYYGQNDYPRARAAYLAAVEVLRKLNIDLVTECYPGREETYLRTLSWLYLNLAELSAKSEDDRQVRINLQYARDILLPYGERYPALARELREGEARLYGYLGDAERSLTIYQDLLLATDSTREARYYQGVLADIAYVHVNVREDHAAALRYWERLLNHDRRTRVANTLRLAAYYRETARCHLELERWSAAGRYLDTAQVWLNHNPEAQEQGIVLFMRAYLARRLDQPQEALRLLDAAAAAYEFPPSATRANQELHRGETYYQLYQAHGRKEDLDRAEHWGRTSRQTLIDFEQGTFKRRSFGTEYRGSTDLLLRCLLARYPEEPVVLEEIFQLIEHGKGRSLRLGRRWTDRRLTRMDAAAKRNLDVLERGRLNLLDQRRRAPESDTTLLLALSDSLVILNRRWEALRRSLPDPVQESVRPADIEHRLPEDAALINYFLGDSVFVALTLTREGPRLYHRAVAADWSALIKELNEAVSRPGAAATLKSTSYRTYDLFLAPVIRQLPPNIRRLVLVPDAELSELPWAALCVAPPAGDDYRAWPFLFRYYDLSYLTYAGALIAPRDDRRTERPRVACFAPTYPEVPVPDSLAQLVTLRNSDFWPLPGALREAAAVSELYGDAAGLFVGRAAARDTFQRRAGEYNVLHLAMHALADQRAPDASYLLFTNENQELEPLTNLALLGLDLDTELMVLSACYAGSGPWRAGDGVRSMAYALRQAGVNSVLSNTWAVADRASGKLMLEFHRGLRAELPLDAALRAAQQHYVTTATTAAAAHPYYWSGFRLQGRTTPFEKPGVGWPTWLLIATLTGGLVGWAIRTKAVRS